MKKIAMLHTSSATLAMMQQLIADIMPEVEVMHLVEESMIKQVMKGRRGNAEYCRPHRRLRAYCRKSGLRYFYYRLLFYWHGGGTVPVSDAAPARPY